MAASRAALIWDLVTEQAASRPGQVSAVDVCAAAVEALPVSGAWVTARSTAGMAHLMCVTDEVSEQLAELQMTLGEGPEQDAFTSGSPVLISDLDDGDAARSWPGFTPQARQVKAAAIFALPLRIGAIRVGSLGLYRDTPGPLSTLEFGDALILAEIATVVLLDSQHPDGQAAAAGTGPGRAAPGSGAAPGGDRPGHRDGLRTARRRPRRGLCPAAGLCLCSGPSAQRRRPRYRRPPSAAEF